MGEYFDKRKSGTRPSDGGVMRILHTSDWHLGQTLAQQSRIEEHAEFLKQLLELVHQRDIDAILLCGDVYDNGTPSTAAQRLFFDFLAQLSQTPCRHLVVIGGNHDSPSMLEATRGVLENIQSLSVRVIGSIQGKTARDLIIPLSNRTGQLAAFVIALPFLREQEVRSMLRGASCDDRMLAYVAGIRTTCEKYHAKTIHLRNLVTRWFHPEAAHSDPTTPPIPILATSHLFVSGALSSDSEHEPIGTLGAIPVDIWSSEWDYLALGHLHRRQTVTDAQGRKNRLYYCGSPISLDFSESPHPKGVVIWDTQARQPEFVKIAAPRELTTLSGTLEEIQRQLDHLATLPTLPLRRWLEVRLSAADLTMEPAETLNQYLHDQQYDSLMELLVVKRDGADTTAGFTSADADSVSLRDFDPRTVFESLLVQRALETSQHQQLLDDFDQVMQEMEQIEIK